MALAYSRVRKPVMENFTDSLAKWLGGFGTGLLRLLPAEAAHDLGMALLERGVMEHLPAPRTPRVETGMKVSVPGIGMLAHPIGLAAGFDKQCRAPHGFARMGFSFLEIGTVTPRPQPGSPKPRLFRYPEQKALINRMGFNSDGATTVAARLKALRWRHDEVPLGVNCGKNKSTPPDRAVQDYLQVIEAFKGLAKYFVVNISSPNTPGLRELATPEFVDSLASELGSGLLPSTWVKLDPDTPRRDFQAVIEKIADCGFQGVIVSNTHRVVWPEAGGQSGHPLMAPATACLEWAHEVHKGRLPMIATGGILSGADIFHKLARGALAVQIYTALIYQGPWAVIRLLLEFNQELKLRGFATAADAIGCYYHEAGSKAP